MKKKKEAEAKPRVEVAAPFIGVCHMAVCAEADVTDQEILDVCNTENKSGTSQGWTTVYRKDDPEAMWFNGNLKPVECGDVKGRLHFLVSC